MLPVKFAPGVQADLVALDAQLRAVAFAWMTRLRREPLLGKPLQYRYGQNLQGARKLYVGREDRPSNPLTSRRGWLRFRRHRYGSPTTIQRSGSTRSRKSPIVRDSRLPCHASGGASGSSTASSDRGIRRA